MSNRYIFVSCPVEWCDSVGEIEVGEVSLDKFNETKWNRETIHVPCKKHEYRYVGE